MSSELLLLLSRPSPLNILIGRIILFIVGLIIGTWWIKDPESFWKYFKYVLLFWVTLNVVSFFQDAKDKIKDKDKD
jgi:hypothetical protein